MATVESPSSGPYETIAVLGAGAMGSAIARVILSRGRPTMVWNRTPARARALADHGAQVANSPQQAVEAAELVLICVLDHAAATEVLTSLGNTEAGKRLVNFTSTNPAQARQTAQWAKDHGAQYLDASIMAGPENIGTDEALLFYSGSEILYQEHEDLLTCLGGSAEFYGAEPGLGAAYFTGLVILGYQSWDAYLQALAYVEAEGAALGEFSPLAVESVVSSGSLLEAMTQAVQTAQHPPEVGPLRTHAPLIGDLIESRQQAGIDPASLRQLKTWVEKSIRNGYGEDGFSRIIDQIRPAPHRPSEDDGETDQH